MPGMTVLVAEPDGAVRQQIRDILTKHNYCVVEAKTMDEAMKIMQPKKGKHGIDIVVCNRSVPSATGSDPLLQFLGLRPALPIVMLTEHADLQFAAQMFRQGIVDYLVKPMQSNALLDVIRHAATMRITTK